MARQPTNRVEVANLTLGNLIDSLRSVVCPACRRAKRAKTTLCCGCFGTLIPTTKGRLYDSVGQGDEEAVTTAMKELGRTEFNLPG